MSIHIHTYKIVVITSRRYHQAGKIETDHIIAVCEKCLEAKVVPFKAE